MCPNRLVRRVLWGLSDCLLAACLLSIVAPAADAEQDGKPTARELAPLTTAKAQLNARDLQGADRTLLGLLSVQPRNTEALLLLGIVRGRQGRFAEAEALFDKVLESEPNSLVARRNLAFALFSQNKLEAAAEQYGTALRLAPDDDELKVDFARVSVELGNFDSALNILKSIPPARFPRAAIPVRAAALLGTNRRQEAEAEIPLARPSSEVSLDLAEVFLKAHLADPALRCLDHVNPDSKGQARFYYLHGKAMRDKGELQLSLKDFQRALALEPKSLLVLLAIAEIFSIQGKHADSAAMFEKARVLDPDSPPILRHLVMESMQAGRTRAAIDAATTLESRTKDSADQYLLANVLLEAQEYDSAAPLLERYLSEHPKDARAMVRLGIAYLNQRRYPDARKTLQGALDIQPDLSDATYNLGVVAMKEGQSQDAIQYFGEFVRQNPNNAAAWFDLGVLYLEGNKLTEAEAALRRSLSLDPNGIQTEYNLGLVIGKLGKPEEAKEHLQRYQALLKAERAREEEQSPK